VRSRRQTGSAPSALATWTLARAVPIFLQQGRSLRRAVSPLRAMPPHAPGQSLPGFADALVGGCRVLSRSPLLVGCDRQPPPWRPRQRGPRAQSRVRSCDLAMRRKGLTPVMSETIRHDALVARDHGGIQAVGSHHSHFDTTFDRDMRVASRRAQPLTIPSTVRCDRRNTLRYCALQVRRDAPPQSTQRST